MSKISKDCVVCGKKFDVLPCYVKRFSTCSKECSTKRRCGNSNPNWKGGDAELKHRYLNIVDRCNNPNHSSYKYYGGRGIKILMSWEEFRDWFFENLRTSTQSHKLDVDRIDNDGNYEPANIRLISRSENVAKRNRESPNKYNPLREKRRITVKIGEVIYESLNAAGIALGGNSNFVKRRVKIGTMADGTKIEILKEKK